MKKNGGSGGTGRGKNSKGKSAKGRRKGYSNKKNGNEFVFSDLSKIGDLDDLIPFS